jgi:hypothetical protein
MLRNAEQHGHITATCRYFGISPEAFYQWPRAKAAGGEAALINPKVLSR